MLSTNQIAVIFLFILLVYVIGLHAVQFVNNWMKKNSEGSRIGRGPKAKSNFAVTWSQEFGHPIIYKLDKHVVLLFIN